MFAGGWVPSGSYWDAKSDGKENIFLWKTWLRCGEGEHMRQEKTM